MDSLAKLITAFARRTKIFVMHCYVEGTSESASKVDGNICKYRLKNSIAFVRQFIRF